MSQLLEDKSNVVFNTTELHYTSTMKWQHSWIGSCLSDGPAAWLTLSDHPDIHKFPPPPPRLFPVGLCERWGLRSANAYNPEQLEGSNTNNDCNNWLIHCKMFGTKSNIVLMCAGQQMEHILNLHRIWKNFLNCSLQWCAFNFCVAIAFLPINLCNRSHHL
jgi:hypothetical protein